MNVLKATVELTKASVRVLKEHPRLAAFPMLMIGAIVVLGLVIAGLFQGNPKLIWLWILLAWFGISFLGVFFETALTGESLRALRGHRPSVRSGLGSAGRCLPAVLGYTFITMTVGFLIVMIGRSSTVGVRLARRMVATAWSLVTFFALPVMVQEKRGGYDSVMRSGRIFSRTWGETTLAEVGLRAFLAHLSVVLVALLVWMIGFLGDSPLVIIAIFVTWSALVGLLGALDSIYRSALYIFAVEGVVPTPFDTAELNAIWRVDSPGGDSTSDDPPTLD